MGKFIRNDNKYSGKIIICCHRPIKWHFFFAFRIRILVVHFEFASLRVCEFRVFSEQQQKSIRRGKMSLDDSASSSSSSKRRKLDGENKVREENADDEADEADAAELKHSKSFIERKLSLPVVESTATADTFPTALTLLTSASIGDNSENDGEVETDEVVKGKEEKKSEYAAVDDSTEFNVSGEDEEEGKEEKKSERAAVDVAEDEEDDEEKDEVGGEEEEEEGDVRSDNDGDGDDRSDGEDEEEKMMQNWTEEECEQWNDEYHHSRRQMLVLRNEWRQKDWRNPRRGWKTRLLNWKPATNNSFDRPIPNDSVSNVRHDFEKELERDRLIIRGDYLRKMRDLTVKFREEQKEVMLKEYRRLFNSAIHVPTAAESSGSGGSSGGNDGSGRWKKEWAKAMNSWLKDDVELSVIFSKNPLTLSGKEQVTIKLSSRCSLVFLRRELVPITYRQEDDFSKLVAYEEEDDEEEEDGEEYEDALDSKIFREKMRNRAMGSISFVDYDKQAFENQSSMDGPAVSEAARGGREEWLCFVKDPRGTSCTWMGIKLMRLAANSNLTKYLYQVFITLHCSNASLRLIPFNLWAAKILEIMQYFHVHLLPAMDYDHNGDSYQVSDGKLFQPPICENLLAENYHYFPFHSFPPRVCAKLTELLLTDPVDPIESIDNPLSLSSSSSSSSTTVKSVQLPLSIVEITEPLEVIQISEDGKVKASEGIETATGTIKYAEKVKMGTWINLRCLSTLSVEVMDSSSWNTMTKWLILDAMNRYFTGCFCSNLVSPSSPLIGQWETFCGQMTLTHNRRDAVLNWKFQQPNVPTALTANPDGNPGKFIALEIKAAAKAWKPYKRHDKWLELSVSNGLTDARLTNFPELPEFSAEIFAEKWERMHQLCGKTGLPIPLPGNFFEEQNYAGFFAIYTWFALLSGEIAELIEEVREKTGMTANNSTYSSDSVRHRWVTDSGTRDISLLLKTRTTLGRTLAHLEETAVVLDPLLCAPLVTLVVDYLKVGSAPIPYPHIK